MASGTAGGGGVTGIQGQRALGKLEAEWGLAGGAGAVKETQSLKKMLPWADGKKKC